MSDTPEIHVLPGDTPYAIEGISYNVTKTRGSIPEPIRVANGTPQIQIINSNVVNESNTAGLVIIGAMSAADIKIAYESNPDTNAFTDSEQVIVNSIAEQLENEALVRSLADTSIYTTILEIEQNIPTALSQLSDDTNHRVVTDVEKELWNNKLGPDDTIDGGLFLI